MQNSKALAAQAFLQSDAVCEDLFGTLVSQIEALPPGQRGAEALRLSSHLLELAAYELAGTLKSEQIAAMIECAAHLSDHSDESSLSEIWDATRTRRVVQ